MKVIKKLFFIICIVAILVGCSTASPSQQNQILPTELTSEQQDLVSLLTAHNSEILLFDFVTSESFENVEFWLESYEYGILIDSIQGIHQTNREPQPLDGQLAVIINRENYNVPMK